MATSVNNAATNGKATFVTLEDICRVKGLKFGKTKVHNGYEYLVMGTDKMLNNSEWFFLGKELRGKSMKELVDMRKTLGVAQKEVPTVDESTGEVVDNKLFYTLYVMEETEEFTWD